MELALEKFLEIVSDIGTKLVYSLIILLVCIILIKLSKNFIKNLLNTHNKNSKIVDARRATTVSSLVSSIIKYLIYFIAISSILVQFGVSPNSIIAVAGAASVAIGLGAQSFMQDIIAGFFLIFEDQFGVGDIVSISDKTGVVETVTLRTTVVRGFSGEVYIIPNGSIGIVTNMCKGFINEFIRIEIDNSENADKVIEILKDEMGKTYPLIPGLHEVPQVLGIDEMKDQKFKILILAECDIKENYRIGRELKLKIKNRLDAENISAPVIKNKIKLTKEDWED